MTKSFSLIVILLIEFWYSHSVERNYFPKPIHIIQEIQKFGFPPEVETQPTTEKIEPKSRRKIKYEIIVSKQQSIWSVNTDCCVHVWIQLIFIVEPFQWSTHFEMSIPHGVVSENNPDWHSV